LGQRRVLDGRTNPYGDGKAASRIVSGLKTIALDDLLIRKRFWSDASAGVTTSKGDPSG
jgi:hypothetical protein